MKVVADKELPFLQQAIAPYAEVVPLEGREITAKDIADADALIIRTRTRCDANLLDNSSVRFIATATVGYDHIDMDYCREKGITVVTAQGCNAMSVTHYIAAALAKESPDSTLGIIGVGNIGSRVAELGRMMGMKVLVNDPPRAERDPSFSSYPLGKLLSESDIVTLHVPYTRDGSHPTEGLGGNDFFARMKKGATFINTSRGEITDEKALFKAIKSGKVGRSIIDVWHNEPDIDRELLKVVTIATPHVAGYSAQGKANGTEMAVKAFAEYFGIDELRKWSPEIERRQSQLTGEEIAARIADYYKLEEDTLLLRANPERFEAVRSDYNKRNELFIIKI